MPARKRTLIASRRRPAREEEEVDILADESLTDDSGLTEDEDEEDQDMTDLSDEEVEEEEAPEEGMKKLDIKDKGREKSVARPVPKTLEADHNFMINGVGSGIQDAEVVDFEDLEDLEELEENAPRGTQKGKEDVAAQNGVEKKAEETPFQRRKRDHEAYKRQRDSDPAFVPNRGQFFMHDHRHGRGGSNGFRPFGRNFMRRGGMVGGHHSFRYVYLQDKSGLSNRVTRKQVDPPLAEDKWKHDMHEETLEDTKEESTVQQEQQARPLPKYRETSEQIKNFGRTQLKGTVQITVNLHGMASPIIFKEVPYRVYTKLPLHRPPLRRDKPVRIALPEAPIRYVYPSQFRSFIFIPRYQRPNQRAYSPVFPRSGFGMRGQPYGTFNNRNSLQEHVNTGSAPLSRSSSQREKAHDPAPREVTPSSVVQTANGDSAADSDPLMINGEDTKPIVRLPPTTRAASENAQQTSSEIAEANGEQATVTAKPPPVSTYPTPPAQPMQEVARPTSTIPMHQPRAQKTVSVGDLENPAALPADYPHGAPLHSRNGSFIAQHGDVQQQMPEAAGMVPPYPMYYPPFYYPSMMHPGMAPMDPFMLPPPPYAPAPSHFNVSAPTFTPGVSASAPPSTVATSSGQNAIAQEQNGTVYFYEPSQYYATFPPVPMIGMPMPITPAPEGVQAPSGDGSSEAPPGGATMMNGMYYYQPPPIPIGQPVYFPA